jgi:DNA mismatch repair protein MutL
MKIRILPPHLRQQIAAGEIIERPASVVKELIENALDAGAQHISVDVEHAGRQLVCVSDDGAGMAPEDVSLAFERFATSKIYESRDIESVRTFGFRGEALPSIAAVSRVELLTRPYGAALGTCARVEGGILRRIGESGAPVGTRVEVRDLFFNTPARRKFLRSLRVELSHIIGVFTTFAVAFPELGWALHGDGRPLFELSASSDRDRVLALYGQDVVAQLEAFDGEGLSGRVWGSFRRDSVAGRRSYRFFVNRRPVRSASLYRAAHAALGGTGMLLLFVEIAPELVDINVHPAKREVRFRDEAGVYDLVLSALSRAITRDRARGIGVAEDEGRYTPSLGAEGGETFQTIGQVENTFIVAVAQGHLYVVDQHAAHERILYDHLLEAIARGAPPRRLLMAPQVLVLASRELQLLEDHRQPLEACGFTLDQFGPGAVAIRTIPEVVPASQAESVCRRLVQRLRDNGAARRDETLPQMLACLAAVTAGTTLSPTEQQRLLRDWGKSAQLHACAHNRPVYFRLSLDEVRRKIGRSLGGCGEWTSNGLRLES